MKHYGYVFKSIEIVVSKLSCIRPNIQRGARIVFCDEESQTVVKNKEHESLKQLVA